MTSFARMHTASCSHKPALNCKHNYSCTVVHDSSCSGVQKGVLIGVPSSPYRLVESIGGLWLLPGSRSCAKCYCVINVGWDVNYMTGYGKPKTPALAIWMHCWSTQSISQHTDSCTELTVTPRIGCSVLTESWHCNSICCSNCPTVW